MSTAAGDTKAPYKLVREFSETHPGILFSENESTYAGQRPLYDEKAVYRRQRAAQDGLVRRTSQSPLVELADDRRPPCCSTCHATDHFSIQCNRKAEAEQTARYALPSELILIIAQFFTVASDFVAFGMINVRHYSMILKHIREPGHKQSGVLTRFVKPSALLIKQTWGEVFHQDERLPNGLLHGTRFSWRFIDSEEEDSETDNNCHPLQLASFPLNDVGAYWIKHPQHVHHAMEVVEKEGICAKQTNWFVGRMHGRETDYLYYPDVITVEVDYNEGKQVLAKTYYDNARMSSSTPFNKNGQIHGDYINRYYQSGHAQEKQQYDNGEEHGDYETWDTLHGTWDMDGKYPFLKNRVQFSHSVIHGVHQTWDESGVLVEHIPFRNGKIHGEVRHYYNDGVLASVRRFVNDLREGESERYYRNGAMKKQSTWRKGERVELKRYLQGELITEEEYKTRKAQNEEGEGEEGEEREEREEAEGEGGEGKEEEGDEYEEDEMDEDNSYNKSRYKDYRLWSLTGKRRRQGPPGLFVDE